MNRADEGLYGRMVTQEKKCFEKGSAHKYSRKLKISGQAIGVKPGEGERTTESRVRR